MTILIKDAETDRIVRELASRTGRSVEDTVRIAAQRELATLPPRKGGVDFEKLEEILARIRSYPRTNEHLTDDEIIGYDENGVPS